MLPLEGQTVIDFSHWFPGPYCTRLLRDLGARVIKIERPVSGDPERKRDGTFSVLNAGKESLAVDLSTGQGQEIIRRLAGQADILIESFQPGTTTKLGIDYETVSGWKKDIIYCSITGYGQTGPLSRLPAHNLNILAETGILGMGGSTGEPPRENYGVYVADLSAAMFAVVSVLGAVMQKAKGGKGAFIDIAMSDCCLSWVSGVWGEYTNGSTKEEVLNHPAYGIFQAEDEKYLSVAALTDHHWQTLCETLGFSDFYENPDLKTLEQRIPMMAKINGRIGDAIKTRDRAYWLDLLRSRGIAANPVVSPEELTYHRHFIERGIFDPSAADYPAAGVAFPALINNERWGRFRPAPPRLGQDSRRILKSLGYGEKEIKNLFDYGVVSKTGDNTAEHEAG